MATGITKNRVSFLGFVAAAVASVALAIPTVQAQSRKIVQIDGSSTVYPVTEAMAEEFQKANKNINVVVGVSGTGGGFKKFCNGETDISGASRPIKSSEIELCKNHKTGSGAAAPIEYIEIPVAYDALTVVVNKADNTWANDITVEELNKMWSAPGNIKSWKQVRQDWPSDKIGFYAPGTDSGTYDYFKEVIVGKKGEMRTDFTASEDDNILVQGVLGDKGGIAFFGYAYYKENRESLRALKINGVAPSEETVEDGSYSPLSRPIFIYVKKSSLNKPEVKAFVEYYMSASARKLISEVGYVELPSFAYEHGMTKVNGLQVGTEFQKNPETGKAPTVAQWAGQ